MVLKKEDYTLINIRVFEGDELLYSTHKEDEKKNKDKKGIYEEGPILYIVGYPNRVFEKHLPNDINEGEIKTINVKNFEDGRKKNLIKILKPSSFENNREFRKGAYYFFQEQNSIGLIKTISLNNDRMIVDFNHPFAGKDLKIEFELVKIITELPEKIKLYLKNELNINEKDLNVETDEKNKLVKLSFKEKKNQQLNPEKIEPMLKLILKNRFKELSEFEIKIEITKEIENNKKNLKN